MSELFQKKIEKKAVMTEVTYLVCPVCGHEDRSTFAAEKNLAFHYVGRHMPAQQAADADGRPLVLYKVQNEKEFEILCARFDLYQTSRYRCKYAGEGWYVTWQVDDSENEDDYAHIESTDSYTKKLEEEAAERLGAARDLRALVAK